MPEAIIDIVVTKAKAQGKKGKTVRSMKPVDVITLAGADWPTPRPDAWSVRNQVVNKLEIEEGQATQLIRDTVNTLIDAGVTMLVHPGTGVITLTPISGGGS